jgi:NAD(P)H-hydrate repair Nnr-like enzyme with NAD(P)H-hydrate dehydratase domain
MAGAAWLAGRAAHAAGAGRVFVELAGAGSDDARAPRSARPELMFRRAWSESDASVIAATTVVCGCGGGDAVRATLPQLLSIAARLVLDADALNAIAVDPSLLALAWRASAAATRRS